MSKRLMWTLLSLLVIASFVAGCTQPTPAPEPEGEAVSEATESGEEEAVDRIHLQDRIPGLRRRAV